MRFTCFRVRNEISSREFTRGSLPDLNPLFPISCSIEAIRGWSIDFDRLTRAWLREAQISGMKLHGAFTPFFGRVHVIPDDWMTDGGKVDTDLVRATRLQPRCDNGAQGSGREDFDVSCGRLAKGVHCHSLAAVFIASNRRLNGEPIRGDGAHYDCQIPPLCRLLLDLPG